MSFWNFHLYPEKLVSQEGYDFRWESLPRVFPYLSIFMTFIV